MSDKTALTVKDIVRQYLEWHELDGLHGNDCGCLLDGLFHCEGCGVGQNMYDCVPARKVPCNCGDDCEWGQESLHMSGTVTADEAVELWRKHKEGHDG